MIKWFVIDRIDSLETEDRWLGKFVDKGSIRSILNFQENFGLARPDGSPLCIVLKQAIPTPEMAAFYQAIHRRIGVSHNRGLAAGGKDPKRVKRDGTIATTREAKVVHSSVMGFFDRYPRTPFCRKTAFNQDNPIAFAACLAAIRRCSDLFAMHVPDRWEAQAKMVEKTSPDFVIPGTVFTTITLNKNFRTACHRDAGDLPEGFGVMAYMRSGRFSGGDLCFPAYGVGAHLDSGDLVLFDPHEIHGNTEIEPHSEHWERITTVMYYRKKMYLCGSASQELARAKKHGAKGIGSTTLDWTEGVNGD